MQSCQLTDRQTRETDLIITILRSSSRGRVRSENYCCTTESEWEGMMTCVKNCCENTCGMQLSAITSTNVAPFVSKKSLMIHHDK